MPAPAYRLPTDEETARLIAKARRQRAETIAAAVRRLAARLSAPRRQAEREVRA